MKRITKRLCYIKTKPLLPFSKEECITVLENHADRLTREHKIPYAIVNDNGRYLILTALFATSHGLSIIYTSPEVQ